MSLAFDPMGVDVINISVQKKKYSSFSYFLKSMSYIQNNVKSDVTKDIPDFFSLTRKTIFMDKRLRLH